MKIRPSQRFREFSVWNQRTKKREKKSRAWTRKFLRTEIMVIAAVAQTEADRLLCAAVAEEDTIACERSAKRNALFALLRNVVQLLFTEARVILLAVSRAPGSLKRGVIDALCVGCLLTRLFNSFGHRSVLFTIFSPSIGFRVCMWELSYVKAIMLLNFVIMVKFMVAHLGRLLLGNLGTS